MGDAIYTAAGAFDDGHYEEEPSEGPHDVHEGPEFEEAFDPEEEVEQEFEPLVAPTENVPDEPGLGFDDNDHL